MGLIYFGFVGCQLGLFLVPIITPYLDPLIDPFTLLVGIVVAPAIPWVLLIVPGIIYISTELIKDHQKRTYQHIIWLLFGTVFTGIFFWKYFLFGLSKINSAYETLTS
ncbi:hypothetical protein C5Y97_28510 [Blastopirellula marina]|uniref:Uncharacterized protein n=1 Tax=Blastopirellula marina TaxID=124 RepID=A0A2S8F4X7_9BACT|nr:hypothetical protein C5Y98_28495 [Blastopirellula marina]PTL41334.1 hypothetical protein C5Y97_28510 [Blastopirellula marina]